MFVKVLYKNKEGKEMGYVKNIQDVFMDTFFDEKTHEITSYGVSVTIEEPHFFILQEVSYELARETYDKIVGALERGKKNITLDFREVEK